MLKVIEILMINNNFKNLILIKYKKKRFFGFYLSEDVSNSRYLS